MDLVKVHEGHMRVLENEIASHKAALHQADLKEAALLREQEALALEAKQMDEKLKAAQDLLDMKKKEASDVQAMVSQRPHTYLYFEDHGPSKHFTGNETLFILIIILKFEPVAKPSLSALHQ